MFGVDLEAQGTSAPQRAVSSTDELLRVKINNDAAGFLLSATAGKPNKLANYSYFEKYKLWIC